MSDVLEGIRVLDLGRFISAPYCGQFLADAGADVIKVEKAGRGEDGRAIGPWKDGVNLYVPTFNRNKRGITVQFRSAAGQELLRRLIVSSDVLIENFRPGTMAQMGLGWEQIHELNPRLVVASISGYGQDGPLATRPAFDPIAQSMSGLKSVTGTPETGPIGAGTTIVDHIAGIMTAYAIMLALYDRERTGKGQYIDTALVDCIVPMLQTYIPNYAVHGVVPALHGNRDLLSGPADVYRCKDGSFVDMHAGPDALFGRLVALIDDDRLRDEKFATVQGRLDNQDELERLVAEWFATQTGDEAEAKLAGIGVPGVVVADIPRLFTSEQGRVRGQLVDIDVPGVGPVTFPANPVKLSEQPVEYNRAPLIGEHNVEVFGELLGLSADDVARLAAEGAI